MHLFRDTRADPHTHAAQRDWIHPALIRFADECSTTFGGLLLYVGALALLAIACIHLWHRLPEAIEIGPNVAAGWGMAPDFAARPQDKPELVVKTNAYESVRQPEGGREDATGRVRDHQRPVAELKRDNDAAIPGSGTPAAWLVGTENPRLRGGL